MRFTPLGPPGWLLLATKPPKARSFQRDANAWNVRRTISYLEILRRTLVACSLWAHKQPYAIERECHDQSYAIKGEYHDESNPPLRAPDLTKRGARPRRSSSRPHDGRPRLFDGRVETQCSGPGQSGEVAEAADHRYHDGARQHVGSDIPRTSGGAAGHRDHRPFVGH